MSCRAVVFSAANPSPTIRNRNRNRNLDRCRVSSSSPFLTTNTPLPFPSAPSRPSSNGARISRMPNRVRSTKSQREKEEVNVEESFTAKRLSGKGDVDEETLQEGTPDLLEIWAIKFEHSINSILTETVVNILDVLYHDETYTRFYVLETIARVPYFAFISVLHLYETLGWWRRADYLKVHFAESWNELHHLLIMEELGGNKRWFDRFLSQSIAVVYYFMTVAMYIVSPRMAYHFSECVEKHAYSTYDKFIKLQGEELKKMPASRVAIKYYMNNDLYMFDEFQTSRAPKTRRPKIDNLYDVFINIRDDEAEHCKTMKACQTHGTLRSPHSMPDSEEDPVCAKLETDCEGIVDCVKKSIISQPQGEK